MADQPTLVLMTQAGYDSLQQELVELQDTKIPAAIDRVATARSFGDLSENSEYHAAREDLAVLNGRLEEVQSILKRAQVATSTNGVVGVGSQVVVEIHGKGDQHRYFVVGEWEANPAEKKISEQSPLGQALVGKKVGEQVEVDVPAGKLVYQIKAVE